MLLCVNFKVEILIIPPPGNNHSNTWQFLFSSFFSYMSKHLDANQLFCYKNYLLAEPACFDVQFSLIIVFKVRLRALRGNQNWRNIAKQPSGTRKVLH
jgi:hypothetical protein